MRQKQSCWLRYLLEVSLCCAHDQCCIALRKQAAWKAYGRYPVVTWCTLHITDSTMKDVCQRQKLLLLACTLPTQ